MDMEQEKHDRKSAAQDDGVIADRVLRLEERLDRLEGRGEYAGSGSHPAWPLALGCTAAVFGWLGMGAPAHPYQYLFAALLVALAYHRGSLRSFSGPWQWPLVATNFLNMGLFFVIVLGGGVRHPLAWFKAPAVVKNPPPDSGAWYRTLVPDYSIQWYAIPGLADWTVDVTKVQVFLLIATLAGALFRFQGFASITALALLIVSIPVYLSFTWDWVVLFLVCASVSLYLQSLRIGIPRLLPGEESGIRGRSRS
jgi:hypothetical protein